MRRQLHPSWWYALSISSGDGKRSTWNRVHRPFGEVFHVEHTGRRAVFTRQGPQSAIVNVAERRRRGAPRKGRG